MVSFSRDPEKFARCLLSNANERDGELRRRAFWRVRVPTEIGWLAVTMCQQNWNRDGDVTRPLRSPPEIAVARKGGSERISSDFLWVAAKRLVGKPKTRGYSPSPLRGCKLCNFKTNASGFE